MNIGSLLKTASATLSKHSPAILTGLGLTGFAATVVMVAKASPTAAMVHECEVENRISYASDIEDENERKQFIKDSYVNEVKKLAPLYGPPAVVGTASALCFIFANKVQADKRAAVMAAYSLSTDTLARYQEKVIERLGENEHLDILNSVTKERIEESVPPEYDATTEIIPAGKIRVYDSVTGRYFYSTKEAIYEAESGINQMLIDQALVKHCEFYYLLGVEESYALGEAMGWDVSSRYGNALKVWLSPHLDDEKNPCLCLNYHVTIFERGV